MRLSEQVRSISHMKAHAAEIVGELAEGARPVIITVNGEAKAILQDLREYERQQETMALLKLLALSQRDVEAGRLHDADEVFSEMLRDDG